MELVDEWNGIRYTVLGMNKWLHRNGFSYRKPAGITHDAVHKLNRLSWKTTPRWICPVHCGVAHVVATTGICTSLYLMEALNHNDMRKTAIQEYDNINSHSVDRLFIAIRETYPITQIMHIISDGVGYHRAGQQKK
ncbi:winged helix-turn-helix domain-containing protein [Kluyvera sp. STS39-E]|uniref:winged helix-turn-helix domain-containing protein n=1 Tax=Kluyvera sp. STS39-E TaxID=3234748 RepID=UPI0034C690EA